MAEWAEALIATRQSVLPRALVAPGPDAAQTEAILAAAAHAPDHHGLTPWRFVVVPAEARAALGEAFAAALIERDPAATLAQQAEARRKAFNAPLVMLAVVRLRDDDMAVPPHERIVSAGCALQNMLLMAHALGWAASLTGGKALASTPLRRLFDLSDDEQALCFLSVGRASRHEAGRVRPTTAQYVSQLQAR